MTYLIKSIIIIFILSIPDTASTRNLDSEIDVDAVLKNLITESREIERYYNDLRTSIDLEMHLIKSQLKHETVLDKKVALLIKKDQLEDQLRLISLSKASDISKIRYLKGLQIIKILYEKSLSLDHHFASVATFNEINNLTNPNHYPEFINIKDLAKDKRGKKEGFGMSSILENNIYTSILHSFVSLFNNSSKSKTEKETHLKDVECILDFTLRMHNDLNTIFFETAFLQKSNDNILIELEQLFIDFTKPINYKITLKECRNSDDWDTVREHLDDYLKELNKALKDESLSYKAHKMQINLEFPIDRLLQFITQYNAHINQGVKFYEKFGIMLNSYENEQQCATKIPLEYKTLKSNIEISIQKFNTAYKPVEINGSKMKQILYGINEYE